MKIGILFAVLTMSFMACGPVKFIKNEGRPACNSSDPCVVGPNTAHIDENYTIAAGSNKVDILFVVDNSGSMQVEQSNLGDRFANFIGSLYNNGQPLDWQVGITTTNVCTGPRTSQEGETGNTGCPDVTDGPYSGAPPDHGWETVGAQGSLLPLVGTSGRIITPNTPDPNTVFKNTVQIPASKTGAGDERPIYAANMAIDKRGGDNSGFFRSGSALAVVMLTDENERSIGDEATFKEKDKPQTLISNVIGAFAGEKSLSVHSITIRNGDTACFNAQNGGSMGIGGQYGSFIQSLAEMTNGRVLDICAPPYDLAGIAGSIVGQTQSILLAQEPLPGTLTITYKRPGDNQFRPGSEIGISETIQGRRVFFHPIPPAYTIVRASFDYAVTGNKVQKMGTFGPPQPVDPRL